MGKVFQGLAVAIALVVLGLAWRFAMVFYAERSMQQAFEQLSEQQRVMAVRQQQQLLEQESRRRQDQQLADAALRERRTLAVNQRCVGGTVITVIGTAYTQDTGEDGRPVHCAGNLAAVPLR